MHRRGAGERHGLGGSRARRGRCHERHLPCRPAISATAGGECGPSCAPQARPGQSPHVSRGNGTVGRGANTTLGPLFNRAWCNGEMRHGGSHGLLTCPRPDYRALSTSCQKLYVCAVKRGLYLFCAFTNPCIFAALTLSHFLKKKVSAAIFNKWTMPSPRELRCRLSPRRGAMEGLCVSCRALSPGMCCNAMCSLSSVPPRHSCGASTSSRHTVSRSTVQWTAPAGLHQKCFALLIYLGCKATRV